MEVLLKGSATAVEAAAKSWSLDFRLSPRKFVSAADDVSRVGSCTLERMTLSSAFDPKIPMPSPQGRRSRCRRQSYSGPSDTSPKLYLVSQKLDIPFDERRGTYS